MAKNYYIGQILLLPKNFALREHRGMYVKVVGINGELLRLEPMGGEVFTATPDDVSARRALGTQARWDILNRDRFRCRVCGQRAGARPGLQLTVDHAQSFDHGGKTEDAANLWTLCTDCNAGKGNLSIEKTSPDPLISTSELNEARELVDRLGLANAAGYGASEEEMEKLLGFARSMIDELERD